MADEVWRAVFDIAVGSMDFGSGFLDDAEVAALREAAARLGTDPDEATPHQFLCKYRGRHEIQLCTDTPYFHAPDGVPLNAFRWVAEYPEHARRFLTGGYNQPPPTADRDLGHLQAKVIQLICTVCWRRWDPFGDTSISPAGGMIGSNSGEDS